MTVKSCEKLEKSQVALTIEVGAAEFETAVEKAYQKMRRKINVPGFRPGKAPRKMIENAYGEGVFYEDAVESSWAPAFMQAVEQENLHFVGDPKIDLEDKITKDGYTFTAVVALYPEVTLGQYKGLEAPKAEVNVTDEDVENRLNEMADRNSRLVSVEREIQKGDTADIDFEGFDNGVPFDGGKGENYSLVLGSHSFVPGFEEQVVGMKAGEEKDIDITFPEEYTPELAGKAVVSVAAGLLFDFYEDLLGAGSHHLSTIPNTPIAVGCGVIACEQKHSLATDEWETFTGLFDGIALIEPVAGHLLSTASAVAGCGPAFAAMFLESLADGGVKNGLPRATAYRLAAQMMAGTAQLHLATGTHPGAMKDAVCSPGGTTIKGVAALEAAGLRNALISAVDATLQ